MAETTTLTGPDLAVGISIADLPENAPVVGHARGEAVVLVRTGAEVRARRRDVYALWRSAG